mmetsp:Transcript_33999/g.52154  ORF Transcript_33999/g.52154 Transcript_33999/m.52154 type:complete len:243 (-) Transcript_33999:51-779(-)
MSGTTLSYWNGRGLMEIPRIMMAIAGKFPSEGGYTDDRRTSTSDCGNRFDANFGRMPVCNTPEGSIGQSVAINYYVASECGLMGSNTLQAAQILSFSEHVKELFGVWRALSPSSEPPSEEILNKFFDLEEATDYDGPADGSKRSLRMMKWFLGRMERLVGDDGFAVGGKLSLADVVFFFAFADNLIEEGHEHLPAHRREPFGSLERTKAALDDHPKIKACVASVAEHPNVKKWIEERGNQRF